ncbi:MAG: MogA/MoaB family molybdenum cofactor biosynthesis protein [Bacillota bacterium]
MYRVGIITASDKGFAGEREDQSSAAIREIISGLGWSVEEYRIVPDDPDTIKEALIDMADRKKLDLVLTTGGTGFSPRDNTPEATKAVVDREVPGIPEVMRAVSLKKTSRAMLSRAAAGIRHRTLIINLPGSQKAVRECLEAILDALPHGLEILTGRGGECGNPAETKK